MSGDSTDASLGGVSVAVLLGCASVAVLLGGVSVAVLLGGVSSGGVVSTAWISISSVVSCDTDDDRLACASRALFRSSSIVCSDIALSRLTSVTFATLRASSGESALAVGVSVGAGGISYAYNHPPNMERILVESEGML